MDERIQETDNFPSTLLCLKKPINVGERNIYIYVWRKREREMGALYLQKHMKLPYSEVDTLLLATNCWIDNKESVNTLQSNLSCIFLLNNYFYFHRLKKINISLLFCYSKENLHAQHIFISKFFFLYFSLNKWKLFLNFSAAEEDKAKVVNVWGVGAEVICSTKPFSLFPSSWSMIECEVFIAY